MPDEEQFEIRRVIKNRRARTCVHAPHASCRCSPQMRGCRFKSAVIKLGNLPTDWPFGLPPPSEFPTLEPGAELGTPPSQLPAAPARCQPKRGPVIVSDKRPDLFSKKVHNLRTRTVLLSLRFLVFAPSVSSDPLKNKPTKVFRRQRSRIPKEDREKGTCSLPSAPFGSSWYQEQTLQPS